MGADLGHCGQAGPVRLPGVIGCVVLEDGLREEALGCAIPVELEDRHQAQFVQEGRSIDHTPVAAVAAGKTVDIEIWRDRATHTIEAAIAKQQTETVASAEEEGGSAPPASPGTALPALGATLAPVSAELKNRFSLPEDASGVVIVGLESNGPAAEQGLQAGDLIEKVSQQDVSTPADVERLAAAAQAAKQSALLLLVNRQGDSLFVALKLSA